jgi:hypothetical protein
LSLQWNLIAAPSKAFGDIKIVLKMAIGMGTGKIQEELISFIHGLLLPFF